MKQRDNRKPAAGQRPFQGVQRWHQLNQRRQGLLRRVEDYAALTIPRIALPEGVDEYTSSIQHDWTSVGAQAVNHLTNKIVLNLFRPGTPFFRLDIKPSEAAKLNIPEAQLKEVLVAGEQDALKVMDQKALRPILNEVTMNLIVTGNALLDLEDPDEPRVLGIKHYAVKRSIKGIVQEILIYERVLYNELEEVAKPYAKVQRTWDDEEAYVEFVRWYRRTGKNRWQLTQHIDEKTLPAEFTKTYTDKTLRVYPLVWARADGHNYGTGLVEDYAGDFGTLSTLSESEIKTAILSSDYRWLANPASVGDIQDVKDSNAGDVLPGKKDDLTIVSMAPPGAVEAVSNSADKVIRRIGSAFLLGSAVTRDAERVTAEEIRMQAQELETSLGGVYSRLAIEFQLPIAIWLLEQVDIDISGTKIEPTIVTGLAALSRNAEAQQLGLFLAALAQLGTVDPETKIRLKMSEVISTLAAAYGITPSKYVRTDDEVNAIMSQQQQAATDQQVTVDAAKAGAQALAKGNQ